MFDVPFAVESHSEHPITTIIHTTNPEIQIESIQSGFEPQAYYCLFWCPESHPQTTNTMHRTTEKYKLKLKLKIRRRGTGTETETRQQ
jgi:hypothetical protein